MEPTIILSFCQISPLLSPIVYLMSPPLLQVITFQLYDQEVSHSAVCTCWSKTESSGERAKIPNQENIHTSIVFSATSSGIKADIFGKAFLLLKFRQGRPPPSWRRANLKLQTNKRVAEKQLIAQMDRVKSFRSSTRRKMSKAEAQTNND